MNTATVLDVPTDIDERGANYHAWCVVCRLRETVCVCFEISQLPKLAWWFQ